MRLTPLWLGFLVACGGTEGGAPPDAELPPLSDADPAPDAADDPAQNDLLDQTFGDGGVASIDLESFTRMNDVAIDDDGSIYYVQGASGSYGRVCRLTSSGSPSGGFDGQDWNCINTEGDAAIAIVPGGIVIADRPPGKVSIARYSSDGERDLTYGGDGTVDLVSPPDVWVRPSFATRTASGGVAVMGDWLAPGQTDPWVATLDEAGTLLGETHATIPGGGFAHDLVALPSGAVIALAHSFPSSGEDVEVLAGYHADASPDPTFGDDGEFWQTRVRNATEIGPLGDGLWSVASEQGTWVGRALHADGTAYDAVELHPARRRDDTVSAGIRLVDGRWLLVGLAGPQDAPVLWLLAADGTPVSDFGDGGRLRFSLPSPYSRIDHIEQGADGAVTVAVGDQSGQGAYLVRVRP